MYVTLSTFYIDDDVGVHITSAGGTFFEIKSVILNYGLFSIFDFRFRRKARKNFLIAADNLIGKD